MALPLGQMSIGSLLIQGLKILFSRLPTLFIIGLSLLIPLLVALVLMPIVLARLVEAPQSSAPATLVPSLLLPWFFNLVMAAGLYVVGQWAISRSPGAAAALEFGLARWFRLLIASIAVLLILSIAPIAAMVAGIVLAPMLGGLLGTAVLFGGLLIAVPLGIYLHLSFLLVTPAVMVDGTGALGALSRSWNLMSGHRWRALGLLIVLMLASLVPAFAASLVTSAFPYTKASSSALSFEVTSYVNLVISMVVTYLITVVLAASLTSVCLALFYFDVRARREGFNLASTAQQWG